MHDPNIGVLWHFTFFIKKKWNKFTFFCLISDGGIQVEKAHEEEGRRRSRPTSHEGQRQKRLTSTHTRTKKSFLPVFEGKKGGWNEELLLLLLPPSLLSFLLSSVCSAEIFFRPLSKRSRVPPRKKTGKSVGGNFISPSLGCRLIIMLVISYQLYTSILPSPFFL